MKKKKKIKSSTFAWVSNASFISQVESTGKAFAWYLTCHSGSDMPVTYKMLIRQHPHPGCTLATWATPLTLFPTRIQLGM
jgi:hypothetical protein